MKQELNILLESTMRYTDPNKDRMLYIHEMPLPNLDPDQFTSQGAKFLGEIPPFRRVVIILGVSTHKEE